MNICLKQALVWTLKSSQLTTKKRCCVRRPAACFQREQLWYCRCHSQTRCLDCRAELTAHNEHKKKQLWFSLVWFLTKTNYICAAVMQPQPPKQTSVGYRQRSSVTAQHRNESRLVTSTAEAAEQRLSWLWRWRENNRERERGISASMSWLQIQKLHMGTQWRSG